MYGLQIYIHIISINSVWLATILVQFTHRKTWHKSKLNLLCILGPYLTQADSFNPSSIIPGCKERSDKIVAHKG